MLAKLQGAVDGVCAHQEPLLAVVHVHMQAWCKRPRGS